TSRDQGALDLAILSQSRGAQNCYLAMAAMRPDDPPCQQLDTPLTRIPFRAAYVPAVSPAHPSKKLTRPLLTKDGRRVLELLVGSSRQGCTEAFLLAHGFTVDLLADMVRAGFATAQSERVRAGGQPIEVTRVHITNAGRRALRGKRTQ